MKRVLSFILLFAVLIGSSTVYGSDINGDEKSRTIIQHVKNLNKSTKWNLVDAIVLNFRTYHPQGMVKIGKYFYLSSVEMIVEPKKFKIPQNGYDRAPGKGVGHLFKFNQEGNVISQITIGEGIIYHPGGIDYDGTYIWAPVAEYRPNSRSIIYRVDPDTLEAVIVFRFNDHIGGIVHNTESHTLHGVSWGSRRFYTWKLDQWVGSLDLGEAPEYEVPKYEMRLNGNHYIDYQDCHYLAGQCMLCSGLNQYDIPRVGKIAFGGLDLIDLHVQIAIHQVPVTSWVKPDLVMSSNPFYVEIHDNRMRFYFIPEDDKSTLYVFDAINVKRPTIQN
jgi:hypothetical protein